MSIAVELDLADDVARSAETEGLLTPEALAELVRAELKRRKAAKFFESLDQLHNLGGTPMTEEEIEAEVDAVRMERRAAVTPRT